MKRMISSVLFLAMLVLILPVNALAADTSDVIYFEDGSFMTIEIETLGSRAAGTVKGNKSYTYTASDGTTCWKATLSGTFTYTGSSSTCTASSCSVTVYESDWSTSSKRATKSGNTAKASVTMVRKALGVTVDTKSASISLTCDANGNLS